MDGNIKLKYQGKTQPKAVKSKQKQHQREKKISVCGEQIPE